MFWRTPCSHSVLGCFLSVVASRWRSPVNSVKRDLQDRRCGPVWGLASYLRDAIALCIENPPSLSTLAVTVHSFRFLPPPSMNTNEENRPGRRGNDPRGANSNQQRQSTSASAASRDGSSHTYQSRRGGKAGSNLSKSSDNIQNGPTTTPTTLPPQDDHVPLAGFNSDVVEAMLKQGYEARAPLYKPDTKSQAATPQSPWGVKRE
ncbi:hypothetical protein, variant [Cladophialophora immunda]|uniref:Uncharacterized protein n=1 Tax=Cladophialophora immunda TaxID=569365 RepID=A0A0D2ADP5_9EURO|nr:hypothetical protein, variant [Cladophialophora immunda]KIW22997.1 hypothetical protein, variant [Cladophialophora immunda]